MNADRSFPPGFMFGVSTSAYQCEGSWQDDGKGESNWDHYVHTFPELIADESNADVSTDSYHKLDEDIAALRFLGVQFYRFSIAWSRILPTGFPNQINAKGISYYNTLIDKLLVHNIRPVVTLYHFDHPQVLQEIGGWCNPKMADYFVSYARVCFKNFGNRVKNWITINEPLQIAQFGYSDGFLVPFQKTPAIGSYLVGHNLLLAHAKAYRMYQAEFRGIQEGKVGIAIDTTWMHPKNPESKADQEAARRSLEFYIARFTNPIFGADGDYPASMKILIRDKSELQGFDESRLPSFSQEEITMIRGSADFLGLNHYAAYLVEDRLNADVVAETPSESDDGGYDLTMDPKWPNTARNLFKVVPNALRMALNWIREEYNNPEVLITEIGYAAPGSEQIQDPKRVDYLQKYLESTLLALADGCNVSGFSVWTLMDNFEWADGYTLRFGLFYVDFNDPDLRRMPKTSARFFRDVIRNHSLPIMGS